MTKIQVKKNIDDLKTYVEAAKVATQSLSSKITIENNIIFPEKFFTEVFKKMPHPDDYRQTKEYRERVKEITGIDPNEAFVWTHLQGKKLSF